MRKPLHAQRFSPRSTSLVWSIGHLQWVFILMFLFGFTSTQLIGQCTPVPQSIEGTVFNDVNYNGEYDTDETGSDVAQIQVIDEDGMIVQTVTPSTNGYFQVGGLTDGKQYSVNLITPSYLSSAPHGPDHQSDVIVIQSPACELAFGVSDPTDYCDSNNPDVAVTCFVKGSTGVNDDAETIVYVEHGFNNQSPVAKIAKKGETGAVFGTAWKSSGAELFSSTFIKQNAFIKDSPGAIYRSILVNGAFQTSLWASLENLGVDAGNLSIADAVDCEYGAQVGKIGIGGMEITPDESQLLVVNLYNKSIVIIDALNPQASSTVEVSFPVVNCQGGEMRPFAIKYHEGKYYASATCDASVSGSTNDHQILVYEFDLETKMFSEVFSTSFTRVRWLDDPTSNVVQHWLTDIEFTSDGNMMLGISDRIAHRYCHSRVGLVNQYPDLLMVENNNGTWVLESNGKVGSLTGSGVGNGQGPGGGEFFGEEFWILGPLYHPEIATGTIYSLPGSDEVVATVFDPLYSTFTGGFHRYSTKNGKKTGVIQLYEEDPNATFGKSSGLGNIVDMCGPAPIQIGNFVWFDADKDGVQDANEVPFDGLQLSLYDNQCNEIAQTTTNQFGEYYFTGELGYHSKYYVVVSDSRFDAATGILSFNGQDHLLTLGQQGSQQRDNNAFIYSGSCNDLENVWVVEVQTSGPGYVNHTFDIGVIQETIVIQPNDTFDLALIKMANVSGPVKLGEIVEYEIIIFNQGTIGAKDIEIVDYLPEGLSFPALLNPGWGMMNGNPSYTLMEEIAPGEQKSIFLSMQVEASTTMNGYINYAEIVSALDENGNLGDDIDSDPDANNDNDNGGVPRGDTDNEYQDDGTEDEDDHDPAVLDILDLALIKTTNFGQTVRPNDDITYTITIENQGNVAATEIEISDYPPAGLELSPDDQNGWVDQNGRLVRLITSELGEGEQTQVEIVLRVNSSAATGNLVNVAEISRVLGPGGVDMTNRDFDSQPDLDSGNDKGGDPEGVTDNEWDDHGAIDEDDHDPAKLYVFDLALIKEVNNELVQTVDQEVIFTFTITNQGEVAANEVTFQDYLPDGFIFNPLINTGWTETSNNVLEYQLAGTLAPNQTQTATLTLFIEDAAFGNTLTNIAEITSALNEDNDPTRDFDSNPDLLPGNDAGGVIGSATDNKLDGNGIDDEDDHDPAMIRAVRPTSLSHDISLEKTGTEHHSFDDTVVFKLNVINEGEYNIGRVMIVDYLPFFLNNIDPKWASHPNGIQIELNVQNGYLPNGGLLPGASVEIDLHTTINQDAFPGYILNTAEVGAVYALDGVDISLIDIDSQSDFDPRNDVSDNPKENQGGAGQGTRPVEDDRAAFEILVSKIERRNTCQCLNDDIGLNNGRFRDDIVVTSGIGEDWYVELAQDIFDPSSPASPGALIPFATGQASGYRLTETVISPELSEYSLSGVFEEGASYFIIVKNVSEEVAHSINGGQECIYDRPGIEGPVNVCISTTQTYRVINPTSGAIYDWDVDPLGGTIVGSDNRSTVRIEWDGSRGGPYTVSVRETSPDVCSGPSFIPVTIGDEFAFSISCIQDAQVSLGPDCESVITPQMLLTGGPYDYDSYNVELADEHGHPITGATLTFEHLGKRIMATVTNSCTGNSCWAWLTVEDKLPPIIECFNDTIRCISLGTYAYPRAVDACDPAPEITLVNEIVDPLDCDDNFIKRVTRMFVAEDNWGNISDTCTQIIMLERIVLDDIVYPDSLTLANGRALQCKDFATDSLGFPLPDSFGVPTYLGIPIYPQEYYCNVGVGYKDTELPQVGCVRKIIREWRVFEWWCTNEIELIRYPQYIEIVDTIPPVITPMNTPMYVHANTRTCDADVLIERPTVTDTCSQVIRVDLVYPGGFIENYTTRTLTLPLDTNILRFRAYDQCYNVDSFDVEVIVDDNIPPVAICDQFTTVGLTDTGLAYIYAQTFDDGSYDNCTLKKMEVKRMDDGANCGMVADTFGPLVEFCCEDVGTNVMVMFRVTDKSGNTNTCMVEVEVQDKIPPRIYCPPTDTINCEFHYDTSDLSIFGEPVVIDNCDFTLKEMVFESVDQCREGYIERVWVAEDGNNAVSCTQRIYIINDTPFDSTNITWPWDFDTTECRDEFLTPDLLSPPYDYPVIDEDFCDLVGITFVDHRFSFVQNGQACYKILRKWKVINWCRFDSTQINFWEHEQVIKIYNEVAPTITSSCDKIEKCIYDDCEVGYIELMASAIDDCTDSIELRWEYHIDLNNDGTVEFSNAGSGPRIDASRIVPLGSHNVRYVFEDKCGNKTVCTQFFDIFNCKPPTAYCKNGLVVDLIPMDLDNDGKCDNEMIEIWAIDLDDNSSSQCDYPLIYSFGRDTTIKYVRFDCRDIGRQELEICVTDPRGYQSCCSTFVIVQDNNMMDCCPKEFDKDCVQGPADVNLTDCDASTLPEDLMSFPVTATCEIDSVTLDYMDEDGTNGDVCQKIKRTWEVTLYLDGRDTTCLFTHCITIDNDFTIDSIIWPSDTLILEGCNPSRDTSNTGGVPVLRGEYCDFVTISFADEQVERDDEVCTYFIRTWTVTNKCDNDKEFTFTQLLIFQNQLDPELTVPGDITVSNDPGLCNAFVTLPPAFATDCSTDLTIVNNVTANGADASGRYPAGTTVITFTATDACGNSTTLMTRVTVEDNEPPTLRCPGDLSFDCDVDVNNIVFGGVVASDNCNEFVIAIDTVYDLNVCNVGIITRNITVTDSAGNVNRCTQTVTIEISDPFTESRITWPADTVIIPACASTDPDSIGRPIIDTSGLSCFNISISFSDTLFMDSCMGAPCTIIERKWTIVDTCQLDGMGGGVFCFTQRIETGDVMFMITCPTDTTIFCEDGIGPLAQYGDVSVNTSCGLDTILRDSIGDLNSCDVGTITRLFTVVDTLGNRMMCQQVITIEIRDPFLEARITWPADSVELGDCEVVTMDKTGTPVVDTTGLSCFDIVITFSDSTYTGVCNGMPCEVIERTWMIVDSCQLDGSGAGIFTFMQIITRGGGQLSVTCPADTTVACDTDVSDLSRFGRLIVNSPCGLDTIIRDSIIDLNDCNIGTITRSIFARDTFGNELMCSQVITVQNSDPFTEADITWPLDTIILDGCSSVDPDSLLSRPIIDTSMAECTKISVSFSDSTRSECMSSPCLIVIRDWTVIDSCQLDTMGNGRFTFRQRLEVNDTTPPVLSVQFDSAYYLGPDTCIIDIDSLVAEFEDCSGVVTITNDSPFADSTGADAGGEYPLGETKFFFYAEDGCCNRDSVEVTINVVDTIAPSIKCIKTFRTMFDTIEGVKFIAEEVVTEIIDNCGSEPADYTISFSLTDPNDTCRFYNCDSLRMTGAQMGLLYIQTIYVIDQSGNVDSCDGLLQVVDMSGCFPMMSVSVNGQVTTSATTAIEDVEVHLKGAQDYMTMTESHGLYRFNDMQTGGSYTVEPFKDDDHLFGVTTKDLILIQKHLLGVRPFTEPYDFISADINNSEHITASDLLSLRRVLLGYWSSFPHNTSWRFIDDEYVFPDPLDPWIEEFPEDYVIDPLLQTMFVDFKGVKIGDVSGDYQLQGSSQTRGVDEMVIEVIEEDGWLHFVKPEGEAYMGAQFTLEFAPGEEPLKIAFSQETPLTEVNFGFHSLDRGLLPVVADVEISEAEMILFSLPKGAIQGGVNISSSITQSLAYTKVGDEVDIILRDDSEDADEGFALYQNRPNPFQEGTLISFNLPADQTARLTIMNMSGQRVYSSEREFEKGYNEVEIKRDILGQSGVYYYRLDCGGYSQTMKMINID